jgi:hypothetical protein
MTEDTQNLAELQTTTVLANLESHPDFMNIYSSTRQGSIARSGIGGAIIGSARAAGAVIATQGIAAPLLIASGIGAVTGGTIGAGTEMIAGQAKLDGIRQGFDAGLQEGVSAAADGRIKTLSENAFKDRVELKPSGPVNR